jgi:hypothetical protein
VVDPCLIPSASRETFAAAMKKIATGFPIPLPLGSKTNAAHHNENQALTKAKPTVPLSRAGARH